MAERKRRGHKDVTDLTGRTDVTTEEIIRGLTPRSETRKRNTAPKRKGTKWDKAKGER